MTEPITDFSTWDRQTLEKFAQDAAAENRALRVENKVVLDQWRELVRKQHQYAEAQKMVR